MSKQKHIHAVIAHIKVAVAYAPDDNLMLLTTQIKEQARKLTGYIECSTTLGKVPAPAEIAEVVVTKDAAVVGDGLDIPAFMKRG